MQQMLEKWHSDCVPAPTHLTYDFNYPLEMITEAGTRDGPFCASPLTLARSADWAIHKPRFVEHCERRRQRRIAEEASEALRARKAALRPLFDRLKDVLVLVAGEVFVSFEDFLKFPSVKQLWRPADVAVDPLVRNAAEQAILRDLTESSRRVKVRLFHRIARCLLADDHPLPPHVKDALEHEPSIFVDYEPSKGLAPLHAALTDADMDPIFARLVALFRCGRCSAKLPYPDIATHMVCEHGAVIGQSLVAHFNLPSNLFRCAVRRLLRELGEPVDIKGADFEDQYGSRRFDTCRLMRNGTLRTTERETWAEVVRPAFSRSR